MAARLTASGLTSRRLVLDEQSLDTLQTVLAAARLAVSLGSSQVIVCTDSYHVPRTRIIFAALGVATRPGAVACGWREMGAMTWLKARLREAAAIPYDAVLALAHAPRFRRLSRLKAQVRG
jgi:uncharacterized SAM-binding protein YcdF (DUF218 family)